LDAGDGGCNAIVNAAPILSISAVPLDPPSQSGGTLVFGTYYATQAVFYEGPDGGSGPSEAVSAQETLVLSPGFSNFAQTTFGADGGITSSGRGTQSFVVSGASLTLTGVCGLTGTVDASYTAVSGDAAPTTIQILLPRGTVGTGSLLITATKQ
jgi:hypothetical protein